ncbi:AMP-dependent synthetase/ligase [Penicillium frequentans]|nr:AMP-dependent synthetase/ligase [Penicillium glabrum]
MDNVAVIEPERTVFSLAILVNWSLELKSVSAFLFTRAVNKTASWLRCQIGISSTIRPLAYIGPRKFNSQ